MALIRAQIFEPSFEVVMRQLILFLLVLSLFVSLSLIDGFNDILLSFLGYFFFGPLCVGLTLLLNDILPVVLISKALLPLRHFIFQQDHKLV